MPCECGAFLNETQISHSYPLKSQFYGGVYGGSCKTLLHTLHSSLHTLHFKLYTLHTTLCTPHFTLHTIHFTLNTQHSTLYTTLYTPHFTLHTLHSRLCSPHSTDTHTHTHTLTHTHHTPHFTLHTPHFTGYIHPNHIPEYPMISHHQVDKVRLLRMTVTHDLCEALAGDITPYCDASLVASKHDKEGVKGCQVLMPCFPILQPMSVLLWVGY